MFCGFQTIFVNSVWSRIYSSHNLPFVFSTMPPRMKTTRRMCPRPKTNDKVSSVNNDEVEEDTSSKRVLLNNQGQPRLKQNSKKAKQLPQGMQNSLKSAGDGNILSEISSKSSSKDDGSGEDEEEGCHDWLFIFPFPFDVEEKLLKKTAFGLKELDGDLLGLDKTEMSVHYNPQVKKQSSITIKKEDKVSLCPGVFLNDSIIDLWMLW